MTSSSSVVGRFAPSPTGHLHLGNAYSLLAAWLAARASGPGNRVILRIEDIDLPRRVPDADRWLMEDLAWLGLDWDGQPVYQSERFDLYEQVLRDLSQCQLLSEASGQSRQSVTMRTGRAGGVGVSDSSGTVRGAGPADGSATVGGGGSSDGLCTRKVPDSAPPESAAEWLTYPCYCSRAQLREASAPHESDGFAVYPGTCRHYASVDAIAQAGLALNSSAVPVSSIPSSALSGSARIGPTATSRETVQPAPVVGRLASTQTSHSTQGTSTDQGSQLGGEQPGGRDLAAAFSPRAGRRPATRLAAPAATDPRATVRFDDRLFGPQSWNLARDVGDVMLRRSDGLFSYQLAVTVDDYLQGVNQIVRGRDLLRSTAAQIWLRDWVAQVVPSPRAASPCPPPPRSVSSCPPATAGPAGVTSPAVSPAIPATSIPVMSMPVMSTTDLSVPSTGELSMTLSESRPPLPSVSSLAPEYAHLPLLLTPTGTRLAKRDASLEIASLRASGLSSELVVGQLAWLLGLLPEPEPISPTDLVPRFSWARIRANGLLDRPVPLSLN